MKEFRAKDIPRDRLLIPRGLQKLQCKHCQDHLKRDSYCEECKTFLHDQCSSCHDELAHDRIKMQNICTFAGRKNGTYLKPNQRRTIETRRKG